MNEWKRVRRESEEEKVCFVAKKCLRETKKEKILAAVSLFHVNPQQQQASKKYDGGRFIKFDSGESGEGKRKYLHNLSSSKREKEIMIKLIFIICECRRSEVVWERNERRKEVSILLAQPEEILILPGIEEN